MASLPDAYVPKKKRSGIPMPSDRRDATQAFADAPIRAAADYTFPAHHHNPMEMHGTTVVWSDDGAITAKSVKALVKHVARCKSVLVGPGTMDEGEAIALELLAAESDAAFVLDAGALPAAESGRALLAALDGRVVLTPHAGEMARLTGRPKEEIEADPLGAAQRAAERYGAVAVMKGAATHIAAPDGRAWRYAGGGVGLGASGSGDVLGGLIAGLLARGAEPAQAAAFGVYLHGEAGKGLASKIGPLGFLAREISAEVPGLMGELA